MKKYIKLKFPSNLIRKAEALFQEEPFLNINCYWIGVSSLLFDSKYEEDVREFLVKSEFPMSSVSVSEFF